VHNTSPSSSSSGVSIGSIVVTGGGKEGDGGGDMELDRWRFWLPEASCPAMAVAGYVDGQLRDGAEGERRQR
jgi:hypothetical protein